MNFPTRSHVLSPVFLKNIDIHLKKLTKYCVERSQPQRGTTITIKITKLSRITEKQLKAMKLIKAIMLELRNYRCC